MVISSIIISLYILEIDVDKSTLSLPLIGADIKNPSALFISFMQFSFIPLGSTFNI